MNCKLVFLVIAALALAQVHAAVKNGTKPKPDIAKAIAGVKAAAAAIAAKLSSVPAAAVKNGTKPKVDIAKAIAGVKAKLAEMAAKSPKVPVPAAVLLNDHAAAKNDTKSKIDAMVKAIAEVRARVAKIVAKSPKDQLAGNVLGQVLFGDDINDGKPAPEEPKIPELPATGDLLSIDWNEIGFSIFNGRIFPTGSASMRSVINTRGTIAALLKIETVGLSGNARFNVCLRKAKGRGSVLVKSFSLPICNLPALNRKALMLTLGMKYIALPAQCPIPKGTFSLSYFYKVGGVDFFRGIPAGQYKIDFSITDNKNILLAFFWRVVIKTTEVHTPVPSKDDKPADSGAKPTAKPPVSGVKPTGKPGSPNGINYGDYDD